MYCPTVCRSSVRLIKYLGQRIQNLNFEILKFSNSQSIESIHYYIIRILSMIYRIFPLTLMFALIIQSSTFKVFHKIQKYQVVKAEDNSLKEYAESVISIIGEAALPTNGNELVSAFISEIIAGYVAGLTFRVVAFAIGDKKRDDSVLTGTTTGTYFGVRSVVRSIGQILGIPRPIAAILAGFTASILSEEIKIVGRQKIQNDLIQNSIHSFKGEELIKLKTKSTKKKGDLISFAEITQDLTKWVAYDLLSKDDDVIRHPTDAAFYGTLISYLVYEILVRQAAALKGKTIYSTEENFQIGSNLLKAGLEGGTLFASYESTITIFDNLLPRDIRTIMSTNFLDYISKLLNITS